LHRLRGVGRSLRQRAVLAVAAVAPALALFAAPALAKHPPAPTSPDQPLNDGCQRSDLGLGFNQSPQWVYVYRNPAIRKAEGVSRVSHVSLYDSQLEHNWYDWNDNLALNQRFRYLLGGSRSQHSGNFSGSDEETGRLHNEWETHTLPTFAWPTDGDRTTIWGSWIWDCAHWTSSSTNEGGQVTGEHTELHPLNAIAVHRKAPYQSPRNVSETDVFVSNQGTKAHAVEECALSHHPEAGGSYPHYDSGFTPCAMDPANRTQPLKQHYRFFVPAPPKPPGASRLKYRIADRIPNSSGHEQVQVKPDGLAVTVSLKGGAEPVRYGKSFFVHWVGDPDKAPTPLNVTLKSLVINQSDPRPIFNAESSPWNLYLDVNGDWNLLNKWAPQLLAVHDGQRIPINHTIKIHVPHGAGVWVQASGRECDEPGGTVFFGVYVNLVHPCPANPDEIDPELLRLFFNDDPGWILDIYPSVKAALGKHVSTSAATVRFPHTGPISSFEEQGQGAYELTYSIQRAGK
jgi:hypothetical protein